MSTRAKTIWAISGIVVGLFIGGIKDGVPVKRKVFWEASHAPSDYTLVSECAFFASEGWDTYLEIRSAANRQLEYRRLIVRNGDTYLPEGFADAEIVERGVTIHVRVNGGIRAATFLYSPPGSLLAFPSVIADEKKRPNQSLEPTSVLGTSAAEPPRVPSTLVAHL